MDTCVRLRVNGAALHELRPGDVIGRGINSSLTIRDPWVSEAHALVSLRQGALKLLGLRGRMAIGRNNVSEAVLKEGLVVHLSKKTHLEICEVLVPPTLLALDHPDLGLRLLTGVLSLQSAPRPRLVSGARVDAAAIFWSDGQTCFVRRPGEEDQPLAAGRVLDISGATIPIVNVEVDDAGAITVAGPGRLEAPLYLAARYDTVHIHREGAPTVTIDGMTARILSDLAVARVPIGWHVLAAELWPHERDAAVLRRNWDATMGRLRKKLGDAGIRKNLVRSDYSGNFEVFLYRGDHVEDQT